MYSYVLSVKWSDTMSWFLACEVAQDQNQEVLERGILTPALEARITSLTQVCGPHIETLSQKKLKPTDNKTNRRE